MTENGRKVIRALTHLSLCSGIGGLDLAAEWAGFETIAQCEIEDYASKVLKKNFPGVHNFGDIRTITDGNLREHGIKPGAVTVLSAGIPCQPYSLAGKGLGDCDSRDLEQELMRVIGVLEPTWVVIENTPGLFARSGQKYFTRILADLAALGLMSDGEYGELAMSEPFTSGKEYLLLPTGHASDGAAWTKICKTDALGGIYRYENSKIPHAKKLIHYLAFQGKSINQSADFYETMMGLPKGWTDLDV